jgi:tRNA-dihydrouridine synthase
MTGNFWKKLKKPFFVLAPMLDITDSPMRQIISECGKPDVFYSWFVSVDGICSSGKENILCRPNLKITQKERPIVVQLFGKDPEKFFQSAKIMAKLGFDGIDINMGCPDKDVLKQGAGAELIRSPLLAREIIQAAKKGAESAGRQVPVTVKTRIGFYKRNEMKNWISEVIGENPAAICVHGRTAKERYGGIADWDAVKEAVKMAEGSGTLIIGNGDIKNREEGMIKARESGADGIMIGRAILSNPWLFNKNKKEVSKGEKLEMLLKQDRKSVV